MNKTILLVYTSAQRIFQFTEVNKKKKITQNLYFVLVI